MQKLKKSYISVSYIILALFLIPFFYSCKSSDSSSESLEDLAVSYDFKDTLSIEYEGSTIDLDTVSDTIKQKFYHNENVYQNNLHTLFKDIVIEKYIKDIAQRDNISIPDATSKAYSSLGFSFLGLNDLEKKEELFKKILEQTQVKLSLKKPQYPTISLETKGFPHIKKLDLSSDTKDTPISIVVFSSLSCLKCKVAYSWLKEIASDDKYKDKLEIIYKPLTLSDLDFLIQFERGALCADAQNFFNNYADDIYGHLSELSDITPLDIVQNIQGINLDDFNKCLSQKSSLLDIDNQESQSLGIYNTPSFFINGRLYPQISSLKDLKDILDEI